MGVPLSHTSPTPLSARPPSSLSLSNPGIPGRSAGSGCTPHRPERRVAVSNIYQKPWRKALEGCGPSFAGIETERRQCECRVDRVFSTAGPPDSAQAKPRWTHFLYYYLLSVSVSVSLCCRRGGCGGGTHTLTRLRGFHTHRINNTPGSISSANLGPARVVCGCYKGLKAPR